MTITILKPESVARVCAMHFVSYLCHSDSNKPIEGPNGRATAHWITRHHCWYSLGKPNSQQHFSAIT